MRGTVLVYGTLRPGGKTVTIRGFKMFNLGWYPGIVQTNEHDDTIICEAVPVTSQDQLDQLDTYEGCNGNTPSCLYHRVNLYEGQEALDPVWIYVYNDQELPEDRHIPHGDWLKHTGEPAGSNAKLVRQEEKEEVG